MKKDCADTFYIHVYAGGIAGQSNSKIDSCFNRGDITLEATGSDWGYFYLGGIVGNAGTISKCANHGDIKLISEIAGSSYPGVHIDGDIGGIVGDGRNVDNSYNTGTISGNINVINSNSSGSAAAYLRVGGIVGLYSGSSSKIMNCYNRGTLGSSANATAGEERYEYIIDNVGEIAGGSQGTLLIQYCYFLNLTSNKIVCEEVNTPTIQDCGPLSDAQMKEQNNFVGFDFDTVWEMGTGDYPYPVLQAFAQLPDGGGSSNPGPSVPPTDENMSFVQEMTETSLKYADSDTKDTINNAITIASKDRKARDGGRS